MRRSPRRSATAAPSRSASGLPVAVYASGPPVELALHGRDHGTHLSGYLHHRELPVDGRLPATGHVTVDDRGDGTGIDLECREDNNTLDDHGQLPLSCATPRA